MYAFARGMTLAVATTAAVLSAAPAWAEMVKLGATLDGAQESPAVETQGKGTAELTYDTDSKKLQWTIEYSGLSSAPAAGHFHGPAGKGENADVAIPLEGDLASPIKGEATLTDEQAETLLAGKYYVNLHTPANQKGEIRGQVEKTM